jgi:hypothetical protein
MAQSHAAFTALLLGFTVVSAALMGAAVAFRRRCGLDRKTAG